MTDREEGAPRRAGNVREERTAERQRREAELGTSWISVILGWLAALGASLILSGLVGAIVGGILAALGVGDGATSGGVSGLIGLLVTLLIAFYIGGYVAGRMASRSEEHTSELQSRQYLVCRLLLEKKTLNSRETSRRTAPTAATRPRPPRSAPGCTTLQARRRCAIPTGLRVS